MPFMRACDIFFRLRSENFGPSLFQVDLLHLLSFIVSDIPDHQDYVYYAIFSDTVEGKTLVLPTTISRATPRFHSVGIMAK